MANAKCRNASLLQNYLVAAVLKGVLAQRLVRCLCPACRRPQDPQAALAEYPQLAALVPNEVTLYAPGGCAACGDTGYRGRTAIAELLFVDETLGRAITSQADAATLLAEARAGGLVDLLSDGLAKAIAGVTSLDEVLRVAGSA